MVWIDSGAERLPAGPNGFVTTVNLDGATYDVYTKDNDLKYIAFVRTSASLSGSLNWSSFIEWTRDNAHRVSSRFGAITDAVQLQDDWWKNDSIAILRSPKMVVPFGKRGFAEASAGRAGPF